jgi:diguanylate cyclase (GGDEF)-like protein/PAS domain S-box-containing protein
MSAVLQPPPAGPAADPLPASTLALAALVLLAALGLAWLLRRLRRRSALLAADMRSQREHARVTLASISDAVVTTGPGGVVESMNPSAERLTGWTAEQARGRPLAEICPLIDENDGVPLADPLHELLREQASSRREGDALALRRRGGGGSGGELVAVEVAASRLRDAEGRAIGAALVLRDVSTLRRMAQRIRWAAAHDALTGLLNRREFETATDAALQNARSTGRRHAVCFIDLDQFKLVNDTSGHAAGDALLRALTGVLQQQLRKGDVLARLGGDEFGVLLEDCCLTRAQLAAEQMLRALRGYRFAWEGRVFSVGASIGLAAVDDLSVSTAEIFSAADAACYWAKDQGRNRVCVHQSSDDELVQRRQEMGWAARLTHALEQGRLTLYHQPYRALKPALADKPHVEILLRLLDEDGRLVPPGTFLPAAERFNLMPRIDRWVIEQVFGRYHALAAQLGAGLVCAINLSGTTLNADGLLEHILEQAHQHRLPPGSVCFEITETAAVNNISRTRLLLRELRQQGFLFALDDFGVGASSFAYLKTLPVDVLKIDGSFVRNIAHDMVDRAMVETINRIGHLMGLHTVGEYAESDAVIAELQALGVDFAQGHAVQRPAPLPDTAPMAGATLLAEDRDA